MTKKRILWRIYIQVLGDLMHCIPVQGITVQYLASKCTQLNENIIIHYF